MNRMIKKLIIAACFFVIGMEGFTQEHMPNRVNTYTDEGSATGFRKENLFVGGSLSLGFGSYNFNVGGAPEIGYSLNKWLDAGVLMNLNYNSERAEYFNNNTRYRSFNYGAGAFARAFPLPFLFFQVQPEYNWIDFNSKYIPTGATASYSTNAPSLLLGVGYGQRVVGQGSFFISLMFDAMSDRNSPYRDRKIGRAHV